jgi:hypothetical protein
MEAYDWSSVVVVVLVGWGRVSSLSRAYARTYANANIHSLYVTHSLAYALSHTQYACQEFESLIMPYL